MVNRKVCYFRAESYHVGRLESLEEEIIYLFEPAPWILECLCSQEEANLSIDDD